MTNHEDKSFLMGSYSTDSQNCLGSDSSISDSIEHVVSDLENAMEIITDLVKKSIAIRAEFQTQWKSILKSYHNDLFTLENALEKLPPSFKLLLEQQKREKERFLQNNISSEHIISVDQKGNPEVISSQHALNFHLQKDCIDSDFQHVFILPPIENIDAGTTVLENELRSHHSSAQNDLNRNLVDGASEILSGHQKQRDDRKKRFNARVKMFQKMDEMRESEENIAQLLFSSMPPVNSKQSEPSGEYINQHRLTEREREELLAELDRCTKQNCEKKIELLTSYHSQVVPKKVASVVSRAEVGKMKKLGLNIPCVESMLQEIQGIVEKEEIERNVQYNNSERTNANTGSISLSLSSELGIESKAMSTEINASSTNAMQQAKNVERSNAVLRNHEQHASSSTRRVVQDPHHFLNIEDLPLEGTTSSSLTLKELVQRNTLTTTL